MRFRAFQRILAAQLPYNHCVFLLAVDTSSASGSLAVLQDRRTIGTVAAATAELYSSWMFRQLEFLLRELSLKMDAFDLFAVAVGPGSFTGLRVGLTAVKGWAEVYGKPIATVSTLEAVATQSHSLRKRLVPVLDARRGQIYFAAYQRNDGLDGGLTLMGSERVGTPKEFLEQALKQDGEKAAIVTPVPELLADLLSRSETNDPPGIRAQPPIEEASSTLAPYIGRLGWLHAKQGRITDPLRLDANYVRQSDAELRWKASTEI